jgi:signal transduction histidine kinase
MGSASSEDILIIPELQKRSGNKRLGSREDRVRDGLADVGTAIAEERPLASIVEKTMTAIADIFGIAEMVFEVKAPEVVPAFHWATYGIPKARAEAIIKNMSAEYHPKDLLGKLLSDKFRISKNVYYIGSDEWLKIVDEDPFSDHPSYYRHPEQARAPRKSKDEWHESDMYKVALRDPSGSILAVLELDFSVDGKLLSKDAIEGIGLFAELLSLALMREVLRSGTRGPSTGTAQRTDLLEDILRIASSIVSERDLRKLSDMILTSVSSLFGFGKVTLVVYDEAEGVFKWIALFGYEERLVREAKQRTIPTDVILEDLREDRRIGKSAYLTLVEDIDARTKAYFVEQPDTESIKKMGPRKKGEFRKGDYLAFALHDSAGRIVGVIYPSEPKDGKAPDKETIETIEIFTSLAEVAVENARLSNEREQALRATSLRTEQLSRILDLASSIMYVRDLDNMLDNLLKTLARLVGTKRMVLGIKHEDLGVYRVEAIHGYSPKAAEAIRGYEYPIESVDTIPEVGRSGEKGYFKWRTKLGRMTYYMPAESLKALSPEELAYYPEPELIRLPRAGKGHWHELDYLDTLIFDKNGVPIAYLETLKPRDDRIPDSDTIEVIEIFATLAGIAIENAKMFQEHIDSRRNAELYTDVLSHDVKNFNQAILGYLDLLRTKVERPDVLGLLNKIAEQVMNTSWLASNVRTMSRVTFGDVELAKTDLGAVLLACQKSISQYYPGRRVVCRLDTARGACFTNADELIRELFINILTNAVKYDSHEPVEIEIAVAKTYSSDKGFWTVSIADHGCGIPDDAKPIIFDRFSRAPKKKGSGMGLHIVKTLAKRYHGRVWVEDRVQGDHSKGSVFKVELPAVE